MSLWMGAVDYGLVTTTQHFTDQPALDWHGETKGGTYAFCGERIKVAFAWNSLDNLNDSEREAVEIYNILVCFDCLRALWQRGIIT